MTIQLYIFTCKLITSSNQSPLVRKEIWLRIDLCGLKPSLSMKILSIIDFFNKLVSNFVMNLSNRVHLAP